MTNELRRREGEKELIAEENKVRGERLYMLWNCRGNNNLQVSDKVSRFQTIYLSLNQYILVLTNVTL